MKYSIRGNIFLENAENIVAVINKYSLWKLITSMEKDEVSNSNVFLFEVWVKKNDDKNNLFNELKQFVNTSGGSIDWHECSHDEDIRQPCEIAEIYRGD